MEIRFNKKGEHLVFSIKGRLDTSNYEEADREITQKINDGEKHLIANLKDMDYISSSGLRVFLSTLKKLKAEGGELKLCCVQDKIMEVFEISGFKSLFAIYQHLEEAEQ